MIFVGDDWAEAHHDVCLLDEHGVAKLHGAFQAPRHDRIVLRELGREFFQDGTVGLPDVGGVLRHRRTTRAPAARNASVTATPSPPVPPVTSTTLPLKSFILSSSKSHSLTPADDPGSPHVRTGKPDA